MKHIDEISAYSQNIPRPINLMEEFTMEMALLHKYDIFNTLSFRISPGYNFAQRKPNGELGLNVELKPKKVNNLKSNDYKSNNQSVSTLTDAAQNMAEKHLSCKVDCSQAFHCLQMLDQRYVEMPTFKIARRNFACCRLVQGFRRSLSALSSLNSWTLSSKQINAHNSSKTTSLPQIWLNSWSRTYEQFSKCIQNAGLKNSMVNSHFGTKKTDFFGRMLTPNGVTPRKQKITKCLEVKFQRPKKALQRYLGFLIYY